MRRNVNEMRSENLKRLIAKITLMTLLTASSPMVFSAPFGSPLSQKPFVVMAAETGTVTVTCSALWTYSRAAWSAKIEVVGKGASFTVVDSITVDGRKMYKLDNGRYITANNAYVSFKAAGTAPAPSAPAATGEMVTTANLYMRSGPGTSYSSIRIIPNGATVTVSESSNGWYKVTYGGSTGWSSGSYLKSVSTAQPVPAPAPSEPVKSSQMTTTVNLYMRTGPGTSYSSIRIIPSGAKVTAYETRDGWIKVSYGGSTGWSSGKYLKAVTATAPPAAEVSTSYMKTTVNLNMRAGVGTSYSVLATMPAGTVVPVSGSSGGWFKVTYNGKTGWASGTYLKAVTNYSEKVLNLPYINQYSPVYAPMGCEGASLLMALQYKESTSVGLKEFLEKMPKTERNPFEGFASTPFAVVKGDPEIFQSIFPEALTAYGNKYDENVVNISDYTTAQLKAEIDKGNPVVVYVTTRDYETPKWKEYDMGEAGIVNIVDNMHVMVLTGYNSEGDYHVTDPASSRNKYWVSREKFEASYNALKWAVVVR